MSLTISVEPELEAGLPSQEAQLLQTINAGLPESFWSRYRELTARRRTEVLTEPEHKELIALSDQTEEKTLQRTEALVALAQLRGIGLDELRLSLGIQPTLVVQ